MKALFQLMPTVLVVFAPLSIAAVRSPGLLTEHHLLEINGQNVVGLKDKETKAIIDECGDVLTITIMPSFIFEHMMKRSVDRSETISLRGRKMLG